VIVKTGKISYSMKIDKVLFSSSSSTEYGPFWNIQSKVFSKMGIEPVCLLYGKKEDAGMVETHGRIVEIDADPNLPWILQLILSKFVYPTCEPDTTWLIGDIDMVPLQKAWFTSMIESVPDNDYVHLNHDGISLPRLGFANGFLTRGPQVLGSPSSPGTDVPGHYHVAKGKHFELYSKGSHLLDIVRTVAESHKYGLGPAERQPRENASSNPYWYYWCSEEMYTSEQIWNAMHSGSLTYRGFSYNNGNNCNRVDRSEWSDATSDYRYDADRVVNHQFVDVHCARPYAKQEAALNKLVELAKML
jgi:hypothetical protein